MAAARVEGSIRLCIVLLLAWALGYGQTNDWVIVPGVRVGPLTASSGRADLERIFGAAPMVDRAIDMGDDSARPGTVVYPNDPSATLAIVWRDETRRLPEQVLVCYGLARGAACRWRTASGIGINTSLRELENANGRPFLLLGFERDFAGTVMSWEGGKLARELEETGRLVLRLSAKTSGNEQFIPPLTASEEAAVLAERIPSDHPAMRKLNPGVYSILVVFSRPF
jgi:hypothetical protein